MPPKRKTATSTSTTTTAATAGTSSINSPPARRRGRPPILRNNEANVSDDQSQPKRQRMTVDDVEASQDLEPQSLSEATNDVTIASRVQDISKDHIQSGITSDPGQKDPQLPSSHPETATTAPTDGEDDGDFSMGLRKGSSESPARKTRGVVQRRGKGVIPATRSSPRKQPQLQLQLQTRHEPLQENDAGVATMNESSLPSSPPAPGASSSPSSSLPLPSAPTLSPSLPPVKRKRGRPPKAAAATLPRVAVDFQSLPDQTVVAADISERKQSTSAVISITTAPAASRANEEQMPHPMDGDAAASVGVGPSGSGRRRTSSPADDDDDDDAPATIVPSQVATEPALSEIAQQQEQQMPRLMPLGSEHHHQPVVSSGMDVSTHPHPHPHLQSHPHPSSLYPPSMPYTYPYSHHGAPSGHYPFAHPPPPSGHPYSSSTPQGTGGIDYSPSFASTVPTTPSGSFSNTYPHHHPHAILDHNAPHGNPFPPPGTSHIGVPNYTQSVYAVHVPVPSPPTLPADLEEHDRADMQLDLTPSTSTNGGGKRKVVPISSNGGKSGGRAGRGDHVACHFCRGRKLKCDGRRPTCGHCSLRNLACAYDDFIRRRGPGKKEKNTKRSHKSPHSTMSDGENQHQSRDQNIMLIGPDIASPGAVGAVAGPSNQAEVLVTVPSQAQPPHAQNSLSSITASTSTHVQTSSQQHQQRRRRRNPTNNVNTTSAQSGTSILRFDTSGNSGGDGGSGSAGILSGLKPSAVAYAVETNERLPVNVNVGMPGVGVDYSYGYHQHPQHHHSQPHMTIYTPTDQAVGYYTGQSHPPHAHSTTTDQGPQHAHTHYAYDEPKDEDHDDEGDEDADGDTDGQGMESQRSQTQQHSAYDPHPHPHHAYAPPPWPTEPAGTHARV